LIEESFDGDKLVEEFSLDSTKKPRKAISPERLLVKYDILLERVVFWES
jgi:hypothetical protein